MNMMDRQALQKIIDTYNADHDTGPEAPVNWQVMALVSIIVKMEKRITELEETTDGHEEQIARIIK